MGYAIIKGGAREYALNRQVQNLTPVDSNYRKNLAANVVATYGSEIDGVYRVTSINLGEATQPYIYALVDSSGNDKAYTGVSINQFSGAITTSAEYTGEAVYVKIKPQKVTTYYETTAATSAFLAIAQHVPTHTVELSEFVYNDVANSSTWQDGISAEAHTMELKVFKVIYDNAEVNCLSNDEAANLSDLQVTAKVGGSSIIETPNTIRLFTISKNTTSSVRNIVVTLSGKYKGLTISKSVTIPQAKNELVSITYKSGPTTANINDTLNASDYKVNARYSNDPNTNVEVTASKIKLGTSGTWSTSVTLSSAGTSSIYLQAGEISTVNPVSVSVSSLTLVWDTEPTPMDSTKVIPYSNGNSTAHSTYQTASSSTGTVASIYDAINKVVNGKLIVKVSDINVWEENSAIIYTNDTYPTGYGQQLSNVDWIPVNFENANDYKEYTLPSTNATHLYVVVRSNATDQPNLYFGHYE